MTAEIAIMNKQAVALAADSAVTLNTDKGQKIFTSVNKIFKLNDQHPVGIMVYGNASLLQVPWETIAKLYSKKLGVKKFNSLQEYCDGFFKFVEKNRLLFPKRVQSYYIQGKIMNYFQYLCKEIMKEIGNKLEKQGGLTKKEIRKIISQKINKEYDGWQKSELLSKITKKRISDFKKTHKTSIQKIRKEAFQKLPTTKTLSKKLDEIAAWLFFKFNKDGVKAGTSGIVIAGFGEKDIFPGLNSYIIEGIADNFLKIKKLNSHKGDFRMGAAILPFAQREMVVRFVEGIDPAFLQFIKEGLYELAGKYPKLIVDNLKMKKKVKEKLAQNISKQITITTKKFLQRFQKIRRESFVDPILQVVGVLPKDELALMAETLITLTSFKRRVSMEDETVGGPVDVVIISKIDGFVWVKRKEYFSKNIQN